MSESAAQKSGKARRLGCLSVVVLALLVLAFPYMLTVWSGSSVCFAGGPRIVSAEQKVSAVLDFLVEQGTLTSLERLRIDPASCCRVDRGGREVPPLDFEHFLIGGHAHFVNVPASFIPKYPRITSNVGNREGVFLLSSCGRLIL